MTAGWARRRKHPRAAGLARAGAGPAHAAAAAAVSGLAVEFGAAVPADNAEFKPPLCAGCGKPLHLVLRLIAAYKERGPPAAANSTPRPQTTPSLAA